MPENQSIWVFGKENRLVSQIEPVLSQHGLRITDGTLSWQGQDYSLLDHSLALAVTHPDNKQASIGFISAASAILPALARKLPHYGRYSMTLFSGTKVRNLLKIQWPLMNSPLQVNLTGQNIPLIVIPPLQPLVR